jgi:predicted AAA+ superfamily ATPase
MNYRLRHIQERIIFLAQHFKVILITGARQIGKSTLLKNLFPTIPHIVFDRISDDYGAKENPALFLKSHPRPLILDEIQYVPELLSYIKRTVDESEAPGQYFLTGSHNLQSLKAAAESMAGRVGIMDLEHFSIFEETKSFTFSSGKQVPPSWLEHYLASPATLVQHVIATASEVSPVQAVWRGGFPGLLDKPQEFVSIFYKSYTRTYIERDALYADISTGSPAFGKFLKIMAVLSAQEINYAHFSRELGLSEKQIQHWEHILKQTYQWREVPSYQNNSLKRIAKRGKGYLTDTGLACSLQGITDPLSLLGSSQLGPLFETYCVNLIFKLITGLTEQPFVYHWRTLSGAEVDIVLSMNGKLYPIKIKSGTTLSKNDARGISAFKEEYGAAVQHGIILYPGTICYELKEGVTALPFNALIKPR